MSKRKNKSDTLIIIVFVMIGVLLFGFLGYRVYNDFFNKPDAKKEIESIGLYGYSLHDRDSSAYKDTFKELNKALSTNNIDYKNYATLVSKLFIMDLFTLDNKLGSTDIGGLQFIHKDLKENFKENMGDTIYKYVEINIDGKRTQELPVVKEVTVSNVLETKYTYNNKDYPAYVVTANWEYEKDLGYQKSMKITFIKDKNILYIVKGE